METHIERTSASAVPTAGIRADVPMGDLPQFFAQAFSETARALSLQHISPTGPPFAKYYGMPGASVDVEAGFPVEASIEADGEVRAGSLPSGPIVRAMHVGPYDTLEHTYTAIQRYCARAGLVPGPVMWETFLAGPDTKLDPSQWRTLICWPVSERADRATGGDPESVSGTRLVPPEE